MRRTQLASQVSFCTLSMPHVRSRRSINSASAAPRRVPHPTWLWQIVARQHDTFAVADNALESFIFLLRFSPGSLANIRLIAREELPPNHTSFLFNPANATHFRY